MFAAHRRRLDMIKAWARHDAEIYQAFADTLSSFGRSLVGQRVLDIGCGANAPMTLLLHAAGANATGIDARLGYRWGLGFRPARYARFATEVGLLKVARKAVGELVYDRLYYSTLAATVRMPLTESGVDLREMPAEDLRFPDGWFDVVHSNATWEHLADVSRANREVARVLRPGGLAYIEIHLFPSLSGGHELPWIVPGRTELGGLLPWRHLRDPRWEPPVYLNRLRERDYRRRFEATSGLEILAWKAEFTEGEALVTPKLLEELADYSREELTRRSLVVVLRKGG